MHHILVEEYKHGRGLNEQFNGYKMCTLSLIRLEGNNIILKKSDVCKTITSQNYNISPQKTTGSL
jgi:hypothetical protein